MQLPPRHFIVATAGHVDHGKSALIKALTGTDPDRLPEEKARGLTIDLGYASLRMEAPGSRCELEVGFVDVPGHEDFLKNMLAGVTVCDSALLAVAADDGWMPQTEEHLQILGYLGISQGVVAITKADLVDPPTLDRLKTEVTDRLTGSTLQGAAILVTSSSTGQGIDSLKDNLASMLVQHPQREDIGKPRLYVDRAFSLHGIGTVVTGTLIGGSLRVGQEVAILPSGAASRIRSLQCYHRQVQSAAPGTRAALNLPGIPVDTPARSGIRRGHLVTLPSVAGKAGKCWDVALQRTRRLQAGSAENAVSLVSGTEVRVHFGTDNARARCVMHGTRELGCGAQCIAQLRFEEAFTAFMGDRFVLRDLSGRHTLAGGIVLEPAAARSGFHAPERQESLRLQTEAPEQITRVVSALLRRSTFQERQSFLVNSNFSAEQAEGALEELSARRELRLTPTLIASAAQWEKLRNRALEEIEVFHRSEPESQGMSFDQLRATLGDAPGLDELFREVLHELVSEGTLCGGKAFRHASFRPSLAEASRTAAEKIRRRLSQSRFDPPSRQELAPDNASRAALGFLLRTGEAIELSPDVVLDSAAFAEARDGILHYLVRHSAATVSDLRKALGTTRRVMVPLLENLDADGLTRREGDRRLLGRSTDKSCPD